MNEKITLLNIDEYRKYKNTIPFLKDAWWLRVPGDDSRYAGYVYCDGYTYRHYNIGDFRIGVRPALIILNLEAKPGDTIERFDYTWTVLDDNLALCDSIIAQQCFDANSNVWETSKLKAWLENWLQTMQIKESTKSLGEPIMVKTPLGEICAKEIPDNDFPGIALTFTGTDGEPGAILEYDCVAKCIKLRVYSKDDPDGEPAAIFKMS